MIKVLIVDDSLVARAHLFHLLSQDPEIEIAGQARSGEEALQFVGRNRPDVITMDLVMPGIDGIETTRRIMETVPIPIVIVTANYIKGDVDKTFQAMAVGAVAIIEKPRGMGHPDAARMARETISTVKAMAGVPVVRRWQPSRIQKAEPAPAVPLAARRLDLVAIGASTGGPPALQILLARLPASFPVPILIVQHIARGFVDGMAHWLQQTIPLTVSLAKQNERPLPGSVYLAPDDRHLEIGRSGQMLLTDSETEFGVRPAVAHLFRSVAANAGSAAAGVLLTGMGRDGSEELKLMRERGSVTFAQDAESSVVHGMPGEAIRLGAAAYVMPPAEIADALCRLTQAR
jgi:two-component system chemotaxis response regulator CheB